MNPKDSYVEPRPRWARFVEPRHFDWTWSMLEGCYSEGTFADPKRHYHDIVHVGACLALVDLYDMTEGLRRMPNSDAVELALFWHDAVYVPGDKRNEELSARLMQSLEPVLTVTPRVLEAAVAAILATGRHEAFSPEPSPSSVVVDIDLSILGSPPWEYDVYVERIRREFSSVSKEAWRAGRSAFLAGMLERPRIFQTDWAKARFETQARDNMRLELSTLERSQR